MKPAIFPSERLLAIDDLDRAIVNLSTHINAATYELLVLIRQFDERAGWLRWSFLNCADWLHWRCDLSVGAAREKVRVAHALKTLPVVSASFRAGELSYSKVRALVRVANRGNEEALLDFALKTTAARVEERCRELRCGTVDSVIEANRAYASRYLTMRRQPERGTMTITVEVPLEAGELIDKALDKARDDNPSAGGETSLENLLLLCSRHHRLVHEGGYRIDKDYRDRWIFKRPDGIAVPSCGYQAGDTIDECREPRISYLQRDSAESFLSRLEKQPAAPPH